MNLDLVFLCLFCVMVYNLMGMHVCFCCVRFTFSVLSRQEIGWEVCLQNSVFVLGST